MTIQQNDCYMHIKIRGKTARSLNLKVSGTGFRATLGGIGLIPIVGKGKILDAILAHHGLIAQIVVDALIEGNTGSQHCDEKKPNGPSHQEPCLICSHNSPSPEDSVDDPASPIRRRSQTSRHRHILNLS